MDEAARPIYDYAGFWRRALALLFDGVIVAFAAQILIGVLGPLLGGTDHFTIPILEFDTRKTEYGPGRVLLRSSHIGSVVEANFEFRAWASAVLYLTVNWLYEAGMQSSKFQATPGKLILGMRVVDTKGQRIGFAQASGRFFASLLSGLLFCIGYLMVAFSAHKQALHDRIAGTLVVHRVSAQSVSLPLPGPLPG